MSDEPRPQTSMRVRSPNYPSMGLQSALEQTSKLFKKIHTHAAPRDVVLGGMGYTTYNGASAVALSAQLKYGLLMKMGENYKITDRAMAILHPRTTGEKAAAIRDAALAPPLFLEMANQFGDHIPDDSLLRANLIRKGFGASAVAPFIHAFRDTMELVGREAAQYNFVKEPEAEEEMQTEIGPEAPTVTVRTPSAASVVLEDGEREMLHGPLSRTVSYRLMTRGDLGAKDLGKLIKILELQKSFLEDSDDGEL